MIVPQGHEHRIIFMDRVVFVAWPTNFILGNEYVPIATVRMLRGSSLDFCLLCFARTRHSVANSRD